MDVVQQAGRPRSREHSYVVPLRDLDAGALSLAGGKAANLGELLRAGLPVPDGFCVTTDAYRDGTIAADLAEIVDELAGITADDSDRAAEIAGRARERILSTAMPAHVAEVVTSAYRALGEPAVAVRSSATAEDLPFASFAGQQDTYLGITGADAVLDAVHRCWASLWTDRAVVYRVRNRIDHAETRLAVVVQRMVDSAVAGVMFTVNPVTGRRGETVIDASPGLGEAVVSGSVNPDHFVLDSRTGAVLERRLGDKRLVVRPRPGGGTEAVARPASETACVSDDQLRALVALGSRGAGALRAAAGHRVGHRPGRRTVADAGPAGHHAVPAPGRRCDGRRAPRLLLLQPGAGVDPAAHPDGHLRDPGDRLLRRPPLRPSAGRSGGRATPGPRRGGAAFFDITTIMRSNAGRAVFPRVLDVMEGRSATVLRDLFADPRLSVVHSSWWPVVRRLGWVAARFGIPLQVAQALARPAAARRRLDRLGRRLRQPPMPPTSTTAQERLDLVVRLLGDAVVRVVPRVMPPAAAGFAMLGLAGRLLGADARPGDLATVLRGLPHNVTTEMDLELWIWPPRSWPTTTLPRWSGSSRRPSSQSDYGTGTLPPVLQDRLRAFLDRYGHRAVAEIDVGVPRWAEEPTHVLGVLANYLRLDDPGRAPDVVFARGAAEAEAMVRTLTDRARRRGPVRGRAVGFALDRARQLAGIRELPKFDIVLVLARARHELLAIGAELAAAGRLVQAPDVFFLDLGEVRAALMGRDLRDVVAGRRADHDREMGRRHVPRVLLSDGTEPEARAGARRPLTVRWWASPRPAGRRPAPRAWCSIPQEHTSRPARSSLRHPPTQVGRRSSSPQADW